MFSRLDPGNIRYATCAPRGRWWHDACTGDVTAVTTYYWRDGVHVTTTALHVDGLTFPFHELDAVWIEQGARRYARSAAVLVLRTLVAAAALAMVAGVLVLLLRSRTPVLGGLAPGTRNLVGWGALLGGPFVLGTLVYTAERVHDRGTREMYLCGRRYGQDILLFGTTNQMRFGQVHRAVVRALEHAV
jgi:Family of unknown function (DUF6232)